MAKCNQLTTMPFKGLFVGILYHIICAHVCVFSMSESCAFLEQKDGSHYADLFRALHLHGITHSKFHSFVQTLHTKLLIQPTATTVGSCLILLP